MRLLVTGGTSRLGSELVKALKAVYENTETYNRVFNVAGGGSWQMREEEFIKQFCAQFNFLPKVKYSEGCTWLGWYNTKEYKLRHSDLQK